MRNVLIMSGHSFDNFQLEKCINAKECDIQTVIHIYICKTILVIIQSLPVKFWRITRWRHAPVSTTGGLGTLQPIRGQASSQIIENIHRFNALSKIGLNAFLMLFIKKASATAAMTRLKISKNFQLEITVIRWAKKTLSLYIT